MSSFIRAQELDITRAIVDAAHEYEQVIRSNDPFIDAFINLACLYWQSTEFGFNAHFRLDTTFIIRAAERQWEVLEEAEMKFGSLPELTFWKLYFAFTSLGEPPFPEKSLELVQVANATRVPYFHIYDQLGDVRYIPDVKKLYQEALVTKTTKNRYIVSILEASFRHWKTP